VIYPYGTTNCAWDTIIPFNELWEQYNRIIKDNGAIVLFSAQPFTTKLIQSNFKDFRYCWYWEKNNKTGAPFAKVQPMRCIEDICVFYKKKPTYNAQGLKKLDKPINKTRKNHTAIYGEIRGKINPQRFTNYPHHLLKFNGVSGKEREHPTQKPVELLEYLVKTYTNKKDVVLDNCMGSGSTGVACMNTGRSFIGFEMDKHYFNIALRRICKADEARGAMAA
jgi:site-specific DNA-methyltransferase (adenine-specific)